MKAMTLARVRGFEALRLIDVLIMAGLTALLILQLTQFVDGLA
ncbi:hypothetical protein [Alsobacter soli]|nr:hypothetical protein [Alsobacter soli]